MDEIIEFLKDMVKYVIIIGVIVLIRIYILTTTEVVGPSMEPNLYEGNILLIDQVSSRFNDYKRFDVISFKESPGYLIKRVIGLPGEKIRYIDNKLYINDELVEYDFKTNGITSDFGPITIPSNEYFVLGDNRVDSTDSRIFGTISKERIIGKVFFEVWPFNKLQVIK